MKFLFIYSTSGKIELASGKLINPGAFFPPLGILYLARMLGDSGHDVEVLDCNAEEVNEEKIKKSIHSSDAVGLTVYSEPRETAASINISNTIRKIDADIPIVIGGPHCSVLPEQALIDHHADICVKGDGEFVITPISKAIEGKTKLSTIPGVYYKEGDEIKKGKPAEQVDDLDKVPFPARHLVDKYEYGYYLGIKVAGGKFTSIISSRGCPHRCRFCQLRYIIPRFKTRSVSNITDEIDEVANDGYSTIGFVDDNFLASKKKAEKIMDHIIQKEIDIKIWISNARVDSADRILYEKMRESGVEIIIFGIESGNQDVLDFYNKRITLDQIRKAVNLSKEMGFFVSASFIFGAPIETKKHFENTIKFAKSLPLDIASFYNLGYLFGAPLWEEAVKERKIQPNDIWVSADSSKGLGNFTEEELIEYTKVAYKSFFFNPRLWFRKIFSIFYQRDLRFLRLGPRLLI